MIKSLTPKISPYKLSIEQTERINQLVMKNVVQKAAKNFMKDDPYAYRSSYRDVHGKSHTLRLTDPRLCNELWTRAHDQKIDIDKLIEDILWEHLFPNESRTQLFGNERSKTWREAKQRRQPTIDVCPHCGGQNFGRPLLHRGQYICFDCEHFFRHPAKKEWQSESTSQSNSSKSSNEPAEESFDAQIKPEHGLRKKIKIKKSRPKTDPWYWRRKARKTVFRGLCPRCGSGWIRRPMPKKTTFIDQTYRTHYRCHQCGYFFKTTVKDWDPDAPLVEPIIEPSVPVLGRDIVYEAVVEDIVEPKLPVLLRLPAPKSILLLPAPKSVSFEDIIPKPGVRNIVEPKLLPAAIARQSRKQREQREQRAIFKPWRHAAYVFDRLEKELRQAQYKLKKERWCDQELEREMRRKQQALEQDQRKQQALERDQRKLRREIQREQLLPAKRRLRAQQRRERKWQKKYEAAKLNWQKKFGAIHSE
jgi:hypothetical protein